MTTLNEGEGGGPRAACICSIEATLRSGRPSTALTNGFSTPAHPGPDTDNETVNCWGSTTIYRNVCPSAFRKATKTLTLAAERPHTRRLATACPPPVAVEGQRHRRPEPFLTSSCCFPAVSSSQVSHPKKAWSTSTQNTEGSPHIQQISWGHHVTKTGVFIRHGIPHPKKAWVEHIHTKSCGAPA